MTAKRRSCRIGEWSARAIARSAAENAAPIRTPQRTGNRTGSGSQYRVSTPSWNAASVAAFVRIFVRRRATNRLPDRLEGVRQIERVDPDRAEIRFEALEPAEAGGPERVSSRHQDEPVVRHEPQRREHVPLVEAHRGDEGAEGHGLTRRGGPCPVRLSR